MTKIVRPPEAPRRKRRRFKLTAALAKGGSAAAVIRRFDPSANSGAGGWVDTSKAFTVYDCQNEFSGQAGNYGWCEPVAVDDGAQWQVVELSTVERIAFLVNMGSGLAIGDSTITVGNVSILWPPDGNLASDPTEIPNTYAWAADDNAPGEAVWDASTAAWRANQIKCPA